MEGTGSHHLAHSPVLHQLSPSDVSDFASCHSSLFHVFSHSIPTPSLRAQGTSRGHSPHTHATASMHMACSQVPSHMLSRVGVLSVPTQREYSGAGSTSLSCSRCSHQLEDVDSVSPIAGLLHVHPVWFSWPSGMLASLPTWQQKFPHAGNLKTVSMWDTGEFCFFQVKQALLSMVLE